METESQGSESDLPKVIWGMRSKTETETAKSAPRPELEGLSAALLFGPGGAGLQKCVRKGPVGALCICRTKRIPVH